VQTNACNDDDKVLYLFNKHGMLHGRLEWPYLTCVGFGFKSGFRKNGGRCRTEYSEGTDVARVWIGVLGYCQGNGRWSCVIDLVL
jgi:hypothetical protein